MYCLFDNEYHFKLFLPLLGDILSSDGESKLAKIVGLPPFPDSLFCSVAINESLMGQLIERMALLVYASTSTALHLDHLTSCRVIVP
jgi:hypothetical protein